MKKLFVFFFLSSILNCGLTDVDQSSQNITGDPTADPGIQVGIVVSADDQTVANELVTLTAENATAFDALSVSSIEFLSADLGFGIAICSMLGVGQPVDNCFGDPQQRFWAFYTLNEQGGWEFSQLGIRDVNVKDGDLIGFVWTGSDENFNPLLAPPVKTLSDIAAAN